MAFFVIFCRLLDSLIWPFDALFYILLAYLLWPIFALIWDLFMLSFMAYQGIHLQTKLVSTGHPLWPLYGSYATFPKDHMWLIVWNLYVVFEDYLLWWMWYFLWISETLIQPTSMTFHYEYMHSHFVTICGLLFEISSLLYVV